MATQYRPSLLGESLHCAAKWFGSCRGGPCLGWSRLFAFHRLLSYSRRYSDPAWAWNPGIKEDVISEVISRGYVVDGGYSLVPKYIENGEGFYDLYATTNSKLFPNSKASEFPLYVVTINAKTGWFKGNGPN